MITINVYKTQTIGYAPAPLTSKGEGGTVLRGDPSRPPLLGCFYFSIASQGQGPKLQGDTNLQLAGAERKRSAGKIAYAPEGN